ncbi:class I SAM-dependent methyltransferase [Methylobacterium sp. SyP6R]|uniref:class I SAM-dependent methyltransferase n=1 Tax=Methylobacterium sp. SyP6R TaxID=2718876 RepID=UPI001F218E6A|nr:class I SAM-dependent methyltransferase [Methylobacterium sp. SyP6R]MCF4127304.1 class I SAM-dependent methyltransferase [Methylobacterium sp. SyP6R]
MRSEISAALVLETLIAGILQSGTGYATDGSFTAQLGDVVDQDSTLIKAPEDILRAIVAPDRNLILDFGCGTGGSRRWIENLGYLWRGVNYLEGMADQVRDQALSDGRIDFYDGLTLPYERESFDVVYSFQVFEHIQDIGKTFGEIERVLKPGGALVGAVSYLEQIHDYSMFNFTPYGLKLACQRAGLRLEKIYPSYDVFTWMARRLLVVTSGSDENSLSETLRRDNNIDRLFKDFSDRMGLSVRDANLFRLMFSAHMTFHIRKPDPRQGSGAL